MIKASEVKKAVKVGEKRCSKEFIAAFEEHVKAALNKCIQENNGGKKTLDAAVAHLIFGSIK